MCTALLDSLESASGYFDRDGLLELRYINALLLEVWVFARLARRVELGSTGPVGVAAANL